VNELALFTGTGGGLLGSGLLGWRTVCAVEIDRFAREVLFQRQRDGVLPRFPIWDDVRTFDGNAWTGAVDVVTGGFPCQDISIAGNGAGIDGERSGLWVEMARIVREVRPRYVFVENSPMLLKRGVDRVLGTLAEMGFDARWGVFGADNVGASHDRKRIWILGSNPDRVHADGNVRPRRQGVRVCEWFDAKDREEWNLRLRKLGAIDDSSRVTSYPDALRSLSGMANRVDRLAAVGNGQVPAVVQFAWQQLSKEHDVNG
jgi:DNA (cytosine-5)-methyltransferase 1